MNRPGGVFISYRREARGAARALHERLRREFGDRVFLDIEGLAAGDDFVEAIDRQIESCAAVIALIDRGWLDASDAQRRRRLDDENDFVRIELRAALQRGVEVIPVLVDGAAMPPEEQLPDDLKRLAWLHYVEMDLDSFDAVVGFVVRRVRTAIERADEPPMSSAASPPAPTGAMNATAPGSDSAAVTGSSGRSGGRPKVEALAPAPLPAPRLRPALRALLRPNPGDTRYTLLGRRAYWIGLACVFAAGVLAPYALPGPMRALRGAAEAPGDATQALAPGTRFRDCRDDTCPWLVVLREGSFTMGSPAGEEGRDDDEGPQRRVTIGRRLAVMETEATRAQFAAFVNETGYRSEGGCFTLQADGSGELDKEADWSDPRFPGFTQTGDHPAVCIGWHDAQAFAAWMSKRTNQTYRLLSEAEWEYAARAGSTERYSFGDAERDLCRYANVADRTLKARLPAYRFATADCDDGALYTAPVRSYGPNRWGLHDMHGNAWEWVQDCWRDSYDGAPGDGSAVESGSSSAPESRAAQRQQALPIAGANGAKAGATACSERLLRGGAWSDEPTSARSANRGHDGPADRSGSTGLRLTRMLP